MNRMKLVLLSLALCGICPIAWSQGETQQKTETAAEQEQPGWEQDMEERLAQARERMEAAAREVAELSGKLVGHAVDFAAFPHLQQRASLGVNISLVDDQDKGEGLRIMGISPGGPAAEAGLESGDVLTSINGKSLAGSRPREAMDSLIKTLETVTPGDKVQVEYRRGDKTMQAEVHTGSLMPGMFPLTAGGGNVIFNAGPPGAVAGTQGMPFFNLPLSRQWGDLELAGLSPALGEYFGTDTGVLVVRAPADRDLKLEDGDVILSIGGRHPSGPGHAMRILHSYAGGETLEMEIMRKKRQQKLQITLPERERGERGGFPGPEVVPLPGPGGGGVIFRGEARMPRPGI